MSGYVVQVPIAGYVSVFIETDIEPVLSAGWDPATEFEQNAIQKVAGFLGAFQIPPLLDHGVEEWDLYPYHKLVAGNANFVDCTEINFESVDDEDDE